MLARATRPLLLCLRPSPSSAAEELLCPPPSPSSAAEDLLLQWGCTDADLRKILSRQPSISRMDPSSLQSKLDSLLSAGLRPPHLAHIISCRPRFLAGRLGAGLPPRLAFLRTLFRTESDLLRAILRNPSLLSYDVHRTMRPCVDLYARLGVPPLDLGRVLLSRPTAISRSTLTDEKLELIRLMGLPPQAATYKYAVSVLAVSHVHTIREKMANLEKFGFSGDQVLKLFGRSPNVLTLSVDKVQRNMTYLVGTMKLPPRVAIDQPFLLFANLERVLRPRFQVGGRIEELGLEPRVRGEKLVAALRMTEERFLRRFVDCHGQKLKDELRELYFSVKGVARLAAASKSSTAHRGFPF
ncbi:mitochondrial transcription termination factor family protein [Wolffia australiana]